MVDIMNYFHSSLMSMHGQLDDVFTLIGESNH